MARGRGEDGRRPGTPNILRRHRHRLEGETRWIDARRSESRAARSHFAGRRVAWFRGDARCRGGCGCGTRVGAATRACGLAGEESSGGRRPRAFSVLRGNGSRPRDLF